MDRSRPNRTPLVTPGSIEHHVSDLSATFAADVTLKAAQQKLREQGQWLPVDGDGGKPLGALLARNSTGPLRLGFGAWRDLLLGVQFANGAGELITAGGRTVKNVAGYDLTKFIVGSEGVFGKIVTLTTRAYKAPDGAILAAFDPKIATLNQLLVTPCRPQWAVLTSDALLCGYLGDLPTLAYYETHVAQFGSDEIIRHSLEDDIAAREKLWSVRPASGKHFRASVPPAKITEFVERASLKDWAADATFGVVIGLTASDAGALHQAAGAVGGSVVVYDDSDRPGARHVDPAIGALLGRLKSAFDPNGNLPPLPVQST